MAIWEGMIWQRYRTRAFMVSLGFFLMSGCSIWESYYDPDHGASRADRLCHPFGACIKGKWVAHDGAEPDPTETHSRCVAQVAAGRGNDWKKDSVSDGMEIGECLERNGYTLNP